MNYDQILGHPGMPYYRALLSYNRSKDVFVGNGYELRQLVGKFESGTLNVAVGNRDFRTVFDPLDTHLVRCLHNFLLSGMSFVSHTRVLMKSSFISDAHRQRYSSKVREVFGKKPISVFVQDLRNYVVHYGLPTSVHTLHVTPSERWEVSMRTSDLLAWDRWTAPSREYLTLHQPKLRISDFIDEYESLAVSFHQWFVPDFVEEYRVVLDELNTLQAEWNKSLHA